MAKFLAIYKGDQKLFAWEILSCILASWRIGYQYWTTSFNKAWTQVPCRFKSCSQHARIHIGEDLWQWPLVEVRLNTVSQSIIPQKQFIIIIMIMCSLSDKILSLGCFWFELILTELLKKSAGWTSLFFFLEIINSCAGLVRFVLNDIVHYTGR